MDLNLRKIELVKFSKEVDDFPAEFERFSTDFTLLGYPIGDEAFCVEYIRQHVKKRVRHVLDSLLQVEDTQVYDFLVRLCASYCKVVHLLRSVPPCYSRDALAHFDSEVKQSSPKGLV